MKVSASHQIFFVSTIVMGYVFYYYLIWGSLSRRSPPKPISL